MSGAPQGWSDGDQATLRRMAGQGFSAAEIARTLGKTRNAVAGRAHRTGVRLEGGRASSDCRLPGKGKPVARPAARAAKRAVPAPVAPEPLNLLLEEMAAGQCRFAVNRDPPYRFCGHQTLPGAAWCGFHQRLVYQPVTALVAK